MGTARVRVSLVDATLDIEGAESFVNAQVDKFRDAIRARLAPTEQPAAAPAPADPPADPPAAPFEQADPPVTAPAPVDEVDLTGIFAVSDLGKVEIATDIPGRNRRQQMVNAGKLLAYAAERLQHRRTVPLEDLKIACKAHRCYDPRNLATALRKQRSAFVLDGRRRLQTLSLTDSGRKDAETLVKMLAPPVTLSNA